MNDFLYFDVVWKVNNLRASENPALIAHSIKKKALGVFGDVHK